MNFECWETNTWAAGSWKEGSWCPGDTPPEPPTPLPTMAGGGISYDDFRKKKRVKDDEEIILFL